MSFEMKNINVSFSVNSFGQRTQWLKKLLQTFLVIVLVDEVTAQSTAEMTSTRSVLENVSLSTVSTYTIIAISTLLFYTNFYRTRTLSVSVISETRKLLFFFNFKL